MPYDSSCLYSVIKNTSGQGMYFAFLPPPHGKYLDTDEEVTVMGNVVDRVACERAPVGSRRAAKLEEMVANQTVTIVRLPNPILVDEASGETKMLRVDTTVTVDDPCWDLSESVDDVY